MQEQDQDLPLPIQQVWQAYRVGDCREAVRLGRIAVTALGDQGEAWYALACCLERSGDLLRADRSFSRAARAPVNPHPRPWRVSWPRFGRLVDDAMESLPEDLRLVLMDELTIWLADYADPYLAGGLEDPELLGSFHGSPRGDRGDVPEITPCICVYRRAHEHTTHSAEEFSLEVRRTLYHELGHYVGFDEHGLENLGLG